MRKKTLLDIRNKAILAIVKEEVEAYLAAEFGKVFRRSCATCGNRFIPKMRWHFFCQNECRRIYYRGQFKPRS